MGGFSISRDGLFVPAGKVLKSSGWGTVGATEIADGSITSTDILDGTIAGTDIASGTITSTNILDGTITGTDIAPTTIATSNIVADAVTKYLGAGSVASQTTSNTAFEDLTSFTATTSGGNVLFFFSAAAYHTAAGNQIFFAAQVDSGAENLMNSHSQPIGSYYVPFAGFYLATGVSAASRTFRLRWKSPGGATAAVNGGQFFCIEFKK